jgi:transposase
MAGKRRPQSFAKEFKQEAVLRALSEDRPIAEIARELGIKPHRLYQWRSEFLAKHPDRLAVPAETPEQEVTRLRREVDRLRQERDILNKAVAFFAQNPQ